jgi:hypothetical protein
VDPAGALVDRQVGEFAAVAHPPSWLGVFAFAQMGVQSFGNGSRQYALDAQRHPKP